VFKARRNAKATVELMLVDYPEDLRVPSVSDPSNDIPRWNKLDPATLDAIFYFADHHIHDGGAMVVIHPYDVVVKSSVLRYANSYGFMERKNWVCMNRLHLCHPSKQELTVRLAKTFISTRPCDITLNIMSLAFAFLLLIVL
jgi:hypothetical protein